MITRKLCLFLSFLLTFSLLVGCGLSTNSSGSSNGSDKEKNPFHTTIETNEENGKVIVRYKVKNTSETEQKLTFPSSLEADYILFDKSGNKIIQLSDDIMATQAIKEVTLAKGEELFFEFIIENLVNGEYVVEVFLTADKEQTKVSMDVKVENSTLVRAEGVLVGLADSHTVEIIVDGNPIAYQLSDLAKEQVESINEKDEVEFYYTDGEQDVRTITTFLNIN
ncbi:BsuPI-related putative proteinase inhibitor [Bacillus sp. FJAT-45066]|uniref:BsuPI-related putative proteinase inhibitor n=1 Tax=Bacillus sp. FJAT-45066 TaxID=2011010 RepID=UPI000BB6897F|nr:BsuPI-related putative proteinase inhibitor [Bacillus sp. FJAT-45066]